MIFTFSSLFFAVSCLQKYYIYFTKLGSIFNFKVVRFTEEEYQIFKLTQVFHP